jgi:hypothetical protein
MIPVCSALLTVFLLFAARTVPKDGSQLQARMSSPGSQPLAEANN